MARDARRTTRQDVDSEKTLQQWVLDACVDMSVISMTELTALTVRHRAPVWCYDRSRGNPREGSGVPDLYLSSMVWAGWVELKWEKRQCTPMQMQWIQCQNTLMPYSALVVRAERSPLPAELLHHLGGELGSTLPFSGSSALHDEQALRVTVTAPRDSGDWADDSGMQRLVSYLPLVENEYTASDDRIALCSILSIVQQHRAIAHLEDSARLDEELRRRREEMN